MPTEILGSTRVVQPIGQISGSEFAKVYMGAMVALAQNFQVQYGRQSRPVMSLGDPNIYFVPGPGQGSVALGRLLGADGMFSLLNNNVSTCGVLQNLQFSAGGGRCMVAPTQTLNFGGALLESVALAAQSSSPEIVENYTIRISTLELLN
jgi:hypothetical protein